LDRSHFILPFTENQKYSPNKALHRTPSRSRAGFVPTSPLAALALSDSGVFIGVGELGDGPLKGKL
jgi:hypothetical protein